MTPLATPLSDRHPSVWDAGCESVARTASQGNATRASCDGHAPEQEASPRTTQLQNGDSGGLMTHTAWRGRRGSAEGIELDPIPLLTPWSGDANVSVRPRSSSFVMCCLLLPASMSTWYPLQYVQQDSALTLG